MPRWNDAPEERFWKCVDKQSIGGCWIWIGGKIGDGYGSIYFYGSRLLTHRVSWILLRGDIPEGLEVLHQCDIRACVNPDHLFLGTQLDNMRDCASKKRLNNSGENNPRHILTEEMVLRLREEFDRGISVKDLSERYGIAKHNLWALRSGKTWKCIPTTA